MPIRIARDQDPPLQDDSRITVGKGDRAGSGLREMEQPSPVGAIAVANDKSFGFDAEIGRDVYDSGSARENPLQLRIERVDDEFQGGVVLALQMEAAQADGNFKVFGRIRGCRGQVAVGSRKRLDGTRGCGFQQAARCIEGQTTHIGVFGVDRHDGSRIVVIAGCQDESR